MKESNEKIIHILEHELEVLESETEDVLQTFELCIKLLKGTLKKLRESVISNGFNSKQEEINFFKNTKPKIFSKLIFYIKQFKIKSKCPKGCSSSQKIYLNQEIKFLQDYLTENFEFYLYFKRNDTAIDQYYFISGN